MKVPVPIKTAAGTLVLRELLRTQNMLQTHRIVVASRSRKSAGDTTVDATPLGLLSSYYGVFNKRAKFQLVEAKNHLRELAGPLNRRPGAHGKDEQRHGSLSLPQFRIGPRVQGVRNETGIVWVLRCRRACVNAMSKRETSQRGGRTRR